MPDSEAGDHSAFEADATDFPFQRLPYTQTLLSRLGDSIRSMALDAEVVLYDDDQMLVPHPGVATWTARRIKLDRYDVAGYDRPTAPEDYRSGGDVGSVFTALIPLFGSRQIELTYGESTSWTLAPLLSLGQIMLIRAPGLIEDEDGAAPDFRSGRLYPPQNNLLMTVMNRTVAVPSPNKFTAE